MGDNNNAMSLWRDVPKKFSIDKSLYYDNKYFKKFDLFLNNFRDFKKSDLSPSLLKTNFQTKKNLQTKILVCYSEFCTTDSEEIANLCEKVDLYCKENNEGFLVCCFDTNELNNKTREKIRHICELENCIGYCKDSNCEFLKSSVICNLPSMCEISIANDEILVGSICNGENCIRCFENLKSCREKGKQ